ncbi:MAG: DUF2080 family transposase-associated protein [Deltaproteobacteria bacterium]|nr:DUF2080 family transposase-associated protein [Deltaproteobacteria bacterium]
MKKRVSKKGNRRGKEPSIGGSKNVKLIVHGEEMVEKIVKLSGSSGRVYLPLIWVGSRVKIVKFDCK